MVYNLALNYMQNHEDAQEITQDVFVSVHQSLPRFKGESSVSTWIYRITINRSLDAIKARNRKKRLGHIVSLFGGSGAEDLYTFDHPGVKLEQKAALEKIFRHINELPNSQKTALLLSKTEQRSQAEIAEIMGISTKAVESLLQRAKSTLAKKLEYTEGKGK